MFARDRALDLAPCRSRLRSRQRSRLRLLEFGLLLCWPLLFPMAGVLRRELAEFVPRQESRVEGSLGGPSAIDGQECAHHVFSGVGSKEQGGALNLGEFAPSAKSG